MGTALDLFREQVAQIVKIDNVFDSLEDSATAGKRKVTNELIAGVAEGVKPVADDMIAKIKAIPEEQRYAVYLGFTRALAKEFDKDADAFVTARIPAPTEQTDKPNVSDEQKKTLAESRKSLLERARVLGAMAVDLGEMTEAELEDMLPKRRNLSGPRGKRAISNYDLYVGETKYETMAEVAKANGYEKAAELTKAIRETGGEVKDGKPEGINLTNPPKEFSFTLKNGQVLKATDRRSDAERSTAEAETPENGSDENSDDDDE